MKIAILTSGTLPVPAAMGGAVENLVDFYLEYNEKHGLHDVTVFSVTNSKFPLPEEKQKEKYNHYVQFNTDKLSYKIARKLYSHFHKCSYYNYFISYFLYKSLKLIKKDSFDLVILESRPWYVVDVMNKINVPIVLHQHNDMSDSDLQTFEPISKELTGIICVSDYIRKRMEKVYKSGICKVVYNGIDTNKFKRRDDRPLMRKRLGLKETDYVVVYSGRLVKEKGIKELIEAVSQIEDDDIKLVIIGASFYAGSNQNNHFVTELRHAATQLGTRIIFTGFINYCDVPSYLSMADLAVVPSLCEEALGLSCIEAISVGLPVVATNAGGIPEVVGEPNILIERGEKISQRLADAIVRMKEHPIVPMSLPSCYDKSVYAENFWKAIERFARP